ncbi:biotin/lipoyl-containing protein, partial [Clavibacter michiganensis]|uniref:biotin/lipoyl-containing protein n=1 Tax=Clavibacter michiganensis TaxID=28447 RepID=UPI00292F505C
MADSEFTLPDVGEGLIDAEIVSWRVQPGDRVALNQVIVEIETAKSLVELPSPFEGTVSGLLVQEGQTVEVGTPIIAIAQGSPSLSAPAETPAQMALPGETVIEDDTAIENREPAPAPAAEETSGAVLVGYGTVGKVASRRRRPELGDAAPAARRPASLRMGGLAMIGT